MRPPPILVLGDSHASFFSGHHGLNPIWPEQRLDLLPGLRSCRLGAFLAYSLSRPRHKVRRLVRMALEHVPTSHPVVLVFGEIDCRHHVTPHAHASNRSIERVASEVASAYAQAARELTGQRPLAFWAPSPPMLNIVANEEHPVRGTFPQRLRATRAFNRALRREAHCVGALFLSINDAISDSAGGPRAEFFADSVHLGPQALPLAVGRFVEAGWVHGQWAENLRGAAWACSRTPLPPPPPPPAPPPMPPGIATPHDATRALIDRVALECLALGARRVALYGGGAHTRRIGLQPYKNRGLRIVAILDDSPRANTMLGVRIHRPHDAPPGIETVIISSDTKEEILARRAQGVFSRRGVPVLRIYRWGCGPLAPALAAAPSNDEPIRSRIRPAIRS